MEFIILSFICYLALVNKTTGVRQKQKSENKKIAAKYGLFFDFG